MPDEHAIVPWDESLPAHPAVQLTAQFYQWERRGRGWLEWNHPVELEPPYRPFQLIAPWAAAPPPDDGRRPGLFERVAKSLRGRSTAPDVRDASELVEITEPEPDAFADDGPLTECHITMRGDVKVSRDAAEQLLLSVRPSRPLSFEVLGSNDRVTVSLACAGSDYAQVSTQLEAHFADAALEETDEFLFSEWTRVRGRQTVIIDFGLSHEFMRPLRTARSFDPDPLTPIVAAASNAQRDELALFQVLFQPVRFPWAECVMRAVSDGEGGSFFADAPEMLSLAREKISRPLFAALVRVAACSSDPTRAWELARSLAAGLGQFNHPSSNSLIALEGDYNSYRRTEEVLDRLTYRSGMLLNVEELASFVHLPSASVRVPKLVRELRTTKAAPATAAQRGLVLGDNVHGGKASVVAVSPAQRSRHMHVIGASGTGKSHLLINCIAQDLEAGEGVGVIDPHGDLVEKVLSLVPQSRVNDVILFDPSEEERPVGFNVLYASSALEQNLIASDLVAVFQRLATTWGDQMTAVLSNAVLAFLESDAGGTIADLRRFLVDESFRRTYLPSVRDSEVVYFWQKEFPLLVGKPQGPILTRLNGFLRHKLVRNVVAQRDSKVDFARVMNDGKIFLAKLAQGQIGEENARLLGTLLLSKFHQLALSRQEFLESERRPFYLYVDEFHHFATPSLAAILSGARKYRLSLILAHQDLEQVRTRNSELTSAVLTNPAIRVCFRVGDQDATKLAEGFSTFSSGDLRKLGVGEAICRIERSDWDFNLRTRPLEEDSHDAQLRDVIAAHSRATYGGTIAQAEVTPRVDQATAEAVPSSVPVEAPSKSPARTRRTKAAATEIAAAPAPLPGRGGPKHKYLQSLVRRLAEDRGFEVTVEKMVLDGHGHIDVALQRAGVSIACEISVTTRVEHEVGNLTKCLAAGYDYAVLVSSDSRTLDAARTLLGDSDEDRIRLLVPDGLIVFLDQIKALGRPSAERKSRRTSDSGGPEVPVTNAQSERDRKRLLIAKDAAAYVGLATQTLAKLRVSGGSPPYFKVGRQVLYEKTELDAWLSQRRRRNTSERALPTGLQSKSPRASGDQEAKRRT